ncbi:serine/threonine-protein kinase SMG1 isoform X2 [Fopius arisanus]|uniref:non-specific serine/threonine protein kinase n=1 Tax=Fopius arisanus TaxID=64838 RepID=A0A9R1T419_9HYME|nr:PREDICTED: serine/threonine-protein kinase SMG1 isoform X2 [Fopius arisanus]
MNNCANSTTGTKLRGSKSSELREESSNGDKTEDADKTDKKSKKEVTETEASSNDFGVPKGTLVICQKSCGGLGDHSFSRIKQRNSCGVNRNEVRMARGSNSGERGRGRSGRAFKKGQDRDGNTEGYHPTARQKFQESLKNQDNCSNKYYDDKRINDESRITKLLRRLCREDDYDHFLPLVKQVQEATVAPDNYRIIKRNLEAICETLYDILHLELGNEAKQHTAKCFTMIGYVISSDFKRFLEWIFGKYGVERKDDLKYLLMKSFGDVLKMDITTQKLKDHAMTIMSRLQSTLENVDRPDLLMATVDAILIVTDLYPETFSDHFRDAVDILVGWHIDFTQPKSVTAYASQSLQRLHDFWIADLQFTLMLLSQFLEDMESYDEELTIPNSGSSSPGEDPPPGPKECILRITSLISVFNTVTKSVGESLNPTVTPAVQWSFLTDCLSKMLQTVVKAIELSEKTLEQLEAGEQENEAPEDEQEPTDSPEEVKHLSDSMKGLTLSQKNIDTLVKKVNEDCINDQKHFFRIIKSMNSNKRREDKKNAKSSGDRDNEIEEDKLKTLLKLLKSIELKNKERNKVPLDLSQEKEDLIIASNECICHFLGLLQSRVTKNHELLYKFLDIQLEKIDIFLDDTIISTLNFVSKLIKEVSANLPLELVHKLLGSQSVLLKLRFRHSTAIQGGSLAVYHSLLGLKNIPLLQEAYRYILGDLEIAYKLILPHFDGLVSSNPLPDVKYHLKDAEIVVLFLLRALSDLANASNSIIGMWALKPSILELLAVKMIPHDITLTKNSPLLQNCILFLLYAHCSRYNHFVPSSSLITGPSRSIDIFPGALDVPTASPTSGHLSTILNLISRCFELKDISEQTILLLCKWVQEINTQAETYLGILKDKDDFKLIVSSLLARGATTNSRIALAICNNLEILLNDKKINWSESVYLGVIDLAILHLTSFNTTVRKKYGALLINVPVHIVIPRINRQNLQSETKKLRTIDNYSVESLTIAQRLHMRGNFGGSSSSGNSSGSGEMQAQHFKTYMTYLLQDYDFNAMGLSEIFTLCWSTISESETLAKMYKFGLVNRSFLFFWSGMEAAQHCVLNKLRTPLGKPPETFTSIEGALKALAREISYKQDNVKKDERGLTDSLHEHTRVRLLIEFLEHLERVIHNAAEGCAVALAPLPKPVRTFFHTNKSTCKEWLIRIRLALCVVSLHAGLATNALRNGQRLLEDLVDVKVTHRAEFERVTLCTAQALVILGETEALQGLYIYAKERERKFPWLKAAMEEAAGRYESAAESYKAILKEHPCVKLQDSEAEKPDEPTADGDSHVAAFAMQHLTRCYLAIGDWTQLEAWKMWESEILKRDSNYSLRKQILGNVVTQQAKSLKDFESGGTNTIEELSDWTLLHEKANTNWSCTKTMLEASNTLFNVALRIRAGDEDREFCREKVELCKRIAAKTIEEGLRNMPSEYLSDSILMQYSAQGLADLLEGKSANGFDLSNSEGVKNLGCNVMGQILWWSDYFSTSSTASTSNVSGLRLDLIKSARKEGNFKFAKREMIKYFSKEHLLGFELSALGNPPDSRFSELTNIILDSQIAIKWTQNNMRAFREMAKLLYSMELIEDAVKVCSVTALGISRAIVCGDEPADNLRETGTKLMLTLGKWIQQQEKNVTESPQLNELLRFEAVHNDGLMSKLFGQTTELIPHSDMIIGKLMQLGVNQCPELPEAWAEFAAWCYKWGRKIVDNSHSGQLTETDVNNIRALLPLDTPEADSNEILAILSQNKSIPEDEGDIETNEVKTSDMIENQLRQVPVLALATTEHLSLLVDIWRQAQKRIYSYYELSANAYFKYLELANGESNDCATITATLRLLRLVVKHALELQHVLEAGLSTTPTGPWKEIIPQLFSRLTHPEAYVRTRVSELLCRVAENSPHLVTFPAVVGASSDHRKDFEEIPARYERAEDSPNDFDFDVDEVDIAIQSGNNEDTDSHDEEHKTFMDACFAQLQECLSNGIQDSVSHVKILVKELRRITLLWDELWLATLFQHHTEISKRFEQLEFEIQKVLDNAWITSEDKEKLITEKHRIILKPIVFILENLSAMTSVPAETPHERQFQEKFGPAVEEVIRRLKNPKNPAKPQLASTPLKQLEAKLAQRVNRRGAYSLSMADISPVLASMKDTKIAMPGVFAVDKHKIVTIRSVDNNVQILPTKTKPKKLMFHGSDGHVYTYLFKGLEDLHLDERIMQFLTICNTMMSKNNDTSRTYRARHYSVIPLGPRSGLIQWVDGVTPLFALYKRWQQRVSAMAGTKGGSGAPAVMRPSELFYNKLAPLLKERGIPLENRKEWPLPVLKQVLSELMAETPKDLLAKEIWCNSINAGNWWQATKSYSYSVAVMSIIGYIIGLGDRHLDNVLVDLNTGEIVHIDYNVCFEKGKTLRVPEKVPFRMTPNIKTALGVTGVEGIFRLACEHTLRVMRRGRETLLTLLEAFVYDPLVDWRAGAENSIATYGACQARARCTGVGRKQLEKELTKAMFAVRTIEMKTEWFLNRDVMLRNLPALSRQLEEWLETHEATRQCQDLLQDRHQQLGLIKEAQAIGRSHGLYSVIKRYSTFKRARDAHDKAKLCLEEKMQECEKQMSMHNMALTAIRGPQLARWLSELGTLTTAHEDHMVFDLVKEFLQNAGQNQMIVQCEQSENELTQLATQESLLIRSSLELLSQYSAICSFYPVSAISQHRSVMYHTWLSHMLTTGSVEVCRDVMGQFEMNFDASRNNEAKLQRIIAFSFQIQGIMKDTNEKFAKYYEKMVANEGLPDAQAKIDKTYADTRLQISNFLRREKGAERALEAVNTTALCALNKRYLIMEGAAKCAGECLVDLTSREGDWFLDEMRLMSSLIVELVTIIPLSTTDEDFSMRRSLECLRGADEIYKGLQELNYNFQMIILPEAFKTIITEEPSVVLMVNEVDEIIISIGIPLVDVLNQLELHLRFTLMDMESPHVLVQSLVSSVRVQFDALLSRPPELREVGQDSESLTPGQMLLMGFNGLFEKLQIEANTLVSTLGSLDIPACWKKIDQIREAKEIAAPIFHEGARRVLDDIFLVKRLQAIQEFFTMCREIGNAFKGNDRPMNIYDDERLNKPVKSFTADYVSRQLLGVTSQTLAIVLCLLLQEMGLNVTEEIEQRDIGAESKVSLEDLCRKNMDISLKSGVFTGAALGQASALCSSLEGVWRRKQGARVAQQSVEIARATLQRLQIEFTAHQWLHEDSFLTRANLTPMNPLNRPNFMLELRKTASALTSLQSRVCEAREQQQNLVASVDQRLKWAAGANPALTEVMAAFGNAVLSSNDKLSHQRSLAINVANTCNSILHYEALRTKTSESMTNDSNFAKLMKQWEESCLLRANLSVSVSMIEESLVELLQLDNNIDVNWLRKAEKLIADAIVENQKTLQEKQEQHVRSQERLREELGELQETLGEHHRLMTDVRGLLRTMIKQENIVGLQEFLTEYRAFMESISTVVKELEGENLEQLRIIEAKVVIDSLTEKVSSLYDELLEFAGGSNGAGVVENIIAAKKRAKLVRQDTSVCLSPRKGIPMARDPTTGKAVQERNAYALNVWRRVRMKLEGRDPNSSRKYTTAEQVEYVIREAQSTDNLALLYEGWTPWV